MVSTSVQQHLVTESYLEDLVRSLKASPENPPNYMGIAPPNSGDRSFVHEAHLDVDINDIADALVSGAWKEGRSGPREQSTGGTSWRRHTPPLASTAR